MKNPSQIIGIDEAGRGPLAGPVYVAAVLAPAHFDFSTYDGLTDSKKLSATKREKLFAQLSNDSQLAFVAARTRAQTIDRIGINSATSRALARGLRKLIPTDKTTESIAVLLDGGLSAPKRFTNQETIIKGDQKEPAISLASVVAKVTRDAYIRRAGNGYPNFNFAGHKGYGTKAHRTAIREFGPTELHRRSFLDHIVE